LIKSCNPGIDDNYYPSSPDQEMLKIFRTVKIVKEGILSHGKNYSKKKEVC
jgi:hypothetical protein